MKMDESNKPHQTPKMTTQFEDEINPIRLFEILVIRKKLILLGTALACFATGLISISTPQNYSAESLILVMLPPDDDGRFNGYQLHVSNVPLPEVETVTKQKTNIDVNTYKVLAKSDRLIFALADTLLRTLSSEEKKILLGESPTVHNIGEKLFQNLEVKILQETKLKNVISRTPLLLLSVKLPDRVLPIKITNAWTNLFMARNQEIIENLSKQKQGIDPESKDAIQVVSYARIAKAIPKGITMKLLIAGCISFIALGAIALFLEKNRQFRN